VIDLEDAAGAISFRLSDKTAPMQDSPVSFGDWSEFRGTTIIKLSLVAHQVYPNWAPTPLRFYNSILSGGLDAPGLNDNFQCRPENKPANFRLLY
jgi:hypothetical protein